MDVMRPSASSCFKCGALSAADADALAGAGEDGATEAEVEVEREADDAGRTGETVPVVFGAESRRAVTRGSARWCGRMLLAHNRSSEMSAAAAPEEAAPGEEEEAEGAAGYISRPSSVKARMNPSKSVLLQEGEEGRGRGDVSGHSVRGRHQALCCRGCGGQPQPAV
jgi:hypothetical protein